MRELGIGLYDEMPEFENGNVIIEVYDSAPLFGLNNEQKNRTEEIAEVAIDVAFGMVPVIGNLGWIGALEREFQKESYFKAFPSTILQKDDVVIYYSPTGDVEDSSVYAFRGSELLYEDHTFSGGTTILGKNYMTYASEYKEDSWVNSLANVAEGELRNVGIELALKRLWKSIVK